MFAKERQSQIIGILKNQESVTTAQLTQIFNVSVETVRRDLLELERAGELVRVHGGAIRSGEMKRFSDLTHRIQENTTKKDELCMIATMLVKEEDIIYIDSGSTAIHFARKIKEKFSKLTVITHSVDVFNLLSDKEGFEMILCGGCFQKSEKAFYGKMVLDTIENLHMQKAFIFPSAISMHSGISDFCQELLQVQQAAIGHSDSVFFLADSEKFEKHALIKMSDMSDKYIYVTDSGLNKSYKELYKENNLKVLTTKEEVTE